MRWTRIIFHPELFTYNALVSGLETHWTYFALDSFQDKLFCVTIAFKRLPFILKMLLGANVKSKFSKLFSKHFPKNTILIRKRNCLLANTIFRFWRKKEWSKFLFKEDRLPYDVNITWRCRQTNPSFPYFLEWEAKKDAKARNVTRAIEAVARVGSGIGLGWNGEGWG